MVRGVTAGPAVGLLGQTVLLGMLSATVGLTDAGWLTGLTVGTFVVIALARGLEATQAAGLGPANIVTLIRALLVGAIAALTVSSLGSPGYTAAVVSLSIVALLLDGVDGWVARRTGSQSELGARFDYEVDAFLMLVLCVFIVPVVGWWVLLIGLARYAFVAAGWGLEWMRGTLPPRYWRKVVAATQGIVLTVVASQALPSAINVALLVFALVLLTESFGRDVWWLLRRPSVQAQAWFSQAVRAASSSSTG